MDRLVKVHRLVLPLTCKKLRSPEQGTYLLVCMMRVLEKDLTLSTVTDICRAVETTQTGIKATMQDGRVETSKVSGSFDEHRQDDVIVLCSKRASFICSAGAALGTCCTDAEISFEKLNLLWLS